MFDILVIVVLRGSNIGLSLTGLSVSCFATSSLRFLSLHLHQLVLDAMSIHSQALLSCLLELVDKVSVALAVANCRGSIRFLLTLVLETCHGHTLLSEDFSVYLIIGVFLLNLGALVHEEIKELLALLLHVALVVVNEEWLHDELVKSMQILATASVVSL